MFKFLRTTAFRNLVDGETNVYKKNVFFVGENGQGKTNFLEALYFCAYASSFRRVNDKEVVSTGKKDFSVEAKLYLDKSYYDNLHVVIFVKYENSHKIITLEEKKIEDRKDILETTPCVVFCHEDMEFVSGIQERRRWFFDQTQSLYDSIYLDDLRKYRHVLKTRNLALRSFRLGSTGHAETLAMLDALDPQLTDYGLRLMEKRWNATERFSAVFTSLYEKVSGTGDIGVVYKPSWKSADTLDRRRETDLVNGVTFSGPHRDRYIFTRLSESENHAGGVSIDFSETASTGQRRLLALLLRVAQARCFSSMTGKKPVLLLDDVLLELDGEKRRRFLSVMPDYEQAFFTFLPEEPYKDYCKDDALVYYVKEGVLKQA